MAPRFVARQLSNPKGVGGSVIRFLMNKGNANINAFAVQELGVSPTDHVIEIGFGGGVSLPMLIRNAAFVAGVDRSSDVVASATSRFKDDVASRKAVFIQGSVEHLPFADGLFHKACSVNTVYFWQSLAAGFQEIRRVLAPGGLLALGFLPKEHMDKMNMPIDIFTTRRLEELVKEAELAGFRSIEVRRPQLTTSWAVLKGVK